jgi:hypothetical protein
VLAGREGRQRPLDVHAIRQRDVDGLDVRVRKQLLIAPVRALDAVLRGELLCAAGVAAADGHNINGWRAW